METVEQFRDTLKARIKAILGDDFVVNTSISTLGGADRASVCLQIYGANPINGIAHNSKTHMHIWAHDCLRPDKSFESDYIAKELKFRKIKAKSFDQLHEKICDWIRKRKDQMIEMEKADKGGR